VASVTGVTDEGRLSERGDWRIEGHLRCLFPVLDHLVTGCTRPTLGSVAGRGYPHLVGPLFMVGHSVKA
jgi:hypothetical protein